jgi:hypothetical protein
MFAYRGYEIEIRAATPESGWLLDHYYVLWGGVVVCKQPTREFAKQWVDQTQERFERLHLQQQEI